MHATLFDSEPSGHDVMHYFLSIDTNNPVAHFEHVLLDSHIVQLFITLQFNV